MTIKLYRVTVGSIVLLVVDLIWVLSSELTEYLYNDKKYNKPFFATYVKTSLFTLYLLAFILVKSWRQQCRQWLRSAKLGDAVAPEDFNLSATADGYSLTTATSLSAEQPLYSILDSSGDHINDESIDDVDSSISSNDCKTSDYWSERVLSDPIWVPIKFNSDNSCLNSERSSGTEGTESESDPNKKSPMNRKSNGSQKSVRFSKLTEVRQLSQSQADEALLARLSYQATLRAHEAALRASCQQQNKLSIGETVKLSLMFSGLWFAANWSYQLALKYSEAGLVNLLSSTSSLFTILLSPVFPSNSSSDNFSLTKLVSVIISVGSVAFITIAQSKMDTMEYIPVGALWALSGAFFYASYIVLLRYKVSNEDHLDIPIFFGFVGLFSLIFLWPAFFILHYCQLEVFQWPNCEQLLILLVNGLLGTVLSEFLWLWACFLTSSLLASLSVSLTIPLTILFDVILKGVSYPRLFFVGTIPLYLSFFTITLLSHYDNWDPLASFLMRLVRHSVLRKPVVRLTDPLYSEQTQSLINDSNNSSA
ncbi:solute carrier family 35 member F5-like [Oppia nitens]|uniref:solute carrier family 35 member F5-like n=1 Tax=Oppia nitens TaxID=1686743 RepID=UPI0023DB55B8|nr:solute carrier family 35 member F5-like [Oppia nitens]